MSCNHPTGKGGSIVSDKNAGSPPFAGNDAGVAARELEPIQDADSASVTHVAPRVRRPKLSPRYRPYDSTTDR